MKWNNLKKPKYYIPLILLSFILLWGNTINYSTANDATTDQEYTGIIAYLDVIALVVAACMILYVTLSLFGVMGTNDGM